MCTYPIKPTHAQIKTQHPKKPSMLNEMKCLYTTKGTQKKSIE